MSENNNVHEISNLIKMYSSNFDKSCGETAIILAAGHGKRIKSHTSKMLHKIWGVPTVERVYDACRKGMQNVNTIVVVGIKAEDVIQVIGNRKNTIFAHQAEQHGTGHAVQVGLETFDNADYEGVIYVLPGDMGLIDEATIAMFRDAFKNSNNDMMVLTGLYEGDPMENSYGRIVRVKDTDKNGNPAGDDLNKVIEIIEYKDILAIGENEKYTLKFNGRDYEYSREELLNNNEFNSGVYAFKSNYLVDLVHKLSSDNAQKEIYITDLILLFNEAGLNVGAVYPEQQHVIMGFNNKSVLKEMGSIARQLVYEKIKDIIEIEDPDDFYIDETVIDSIIELDKKGIPLDIKLGKGVYIGKGVKLNYNLTINKNVYINGNVHFGKNVSISQNAYLSTFPEQTLKIEDNVQILWGDIIKGNIVIGEGSKIESSVNMTGSDEFPLRIGKNVQIKGTSYIFGSIIDDDIMIEHSVIIKKRVDKLLKKNGMVQNIKYFLPMPEGIDTISDLQ